MTKRKILSLTSSRILGAVALTAGLATTSLATAAPAGATLAPVWDHLSFPYGYTESEKQLKELNDVAALSGTQAWAVGQVRMEGWPYPPPGVVCPDLFRWNGQKWVNDRPDITCRGALTSVSAAAENDVWATGSTIAYHWNGMAWTLTPYPTEQNNPFYLDDVAAVGGTAFAVGRSDQSSGEVSTAGVIRWDGTAWQKMSLPPFAGNTDLSAVHALAPDDVWAVGTTNRYGPSADAHTLVLHWDGHTWSRLPDPPKEALVETTLDAVAARPGEVWAAGQRTTYEANGFSVKKREAFAMRWNGSEWTVTPTPATTGWYGSSITSLAWKGTEVWAGGSGQDDDTARSVGVLLRWNGTAWQQAPKPPLLDDYRIKQLGAVPGGDLWATGYGTRETDEHAKGQFLARVTG
ncbi:hypothetical protein [Nonomuraea sp. NEAU-A123]|uniref:hypothetical protein n=1 Tax=Nonomuraea sp. NEAU-A123 TaxID=2839649 RepID=UPI001BE4D13B|nr:hypothetical protein [Nonomuraea sp. NEAU-A123]MBT2227802.1 hypothetical protein [Nonomuraea sp. NEAU-A123]